MKKLYLTSVKLNGLLKVINKPSEQIRLAFIPTAADTYENKWFVDRDRERLKEQGISFFEVDIKGKTKEELRKLLKDIDCIYFAGGNTFYLLEKVKEQGADEVIKELVEKGVVYAGGSAGAVLPCPTIEPVSSIDDPKQAPNLKSFEGLNLVNFIILPHAGDPKYDKDFQEIKQKYEKKGYEVVLLTNDEAVIVEGDNWKKIQY